jgi:predicted Zn-dependent peptidase
MIVRGLFAVASCILLATPLHVSALPAEQSGTLPHGGTFIVAADSTAPTAALDLWFRAPDSGYDGAMPGIARVAAASAAAAKLQIGSSLAEIVTSAGGQLTISVYPDLVSVGIVVPPQAARRVLAAATAAYFAPSIDAAALTDGQKDTMVQVLQQQYESDVLAQDALFKRLFTSAPGNQAPVPMTPVDISRITLADVQAYATRAFRSGNAFLTMAGAVDSGMLDAITDGTPASPDRPIDEATASSIPEASTEQADVAGDGIAWIGPPVSDERAATALDFIADYLFGDEGAVARKVRQQDSQVFVRGQFITLHDPGVMLVTLDGATSSGPQETVLAAVRAMQQPLAQPAFDAAREEFLYHIDQQTETPGEQADMLGWYAAEGAPDYAPGGAEYERIARTLDPDYVASVARRYLSRPAVVHIVEAAQSQGGSSI